MGSQASSALQPQTDTASQYSHTWTGGDDPDNPPQPKTLPFQFQIGPFFRAPAVYKWPGTLACSLLNALTFKMWKFTPWKAPNVRGNPIKVFSCSTQNSRVIKPTLNFPTHDPRLGGSLVNFCCGPYIESINVEMWFDYPHALLYTYAPGADVEHGEASGSVSYSFSGGFFGADATAGFSATYTNSHSIQLTDFEWSASSDAVTNRTHQNIRLTMLGDGERYENFGSLTSHANVGSGSWIPMEFSGWGQPPALLPTRAVSDFPYSVEGLWELPGSSDDKVNFHVRVTVMCPVLLPGGFSHSRIGFQQAGGGYALDTMLYQSFVWDHVEPVDLKLAEEFTDGQPDSGDGPGAGQPGSGN